ncbi:MAG: hypothetical protein HYR56_26350 [Acidobacteria bacterium]|nr:hypothetical protein [Acidobacteriota bacterium]MBI3422571.1 hypothetical protein [Acidobacteriota bacterium]
MTKKITRKEFLKSSAASLVGLSLASQRGHAASAVADNPITLENNKPGTTEWELDDWSGHNVIEGYASKDSVPRGGSISFYVNTTASKYTIEIFRLGWYNGAGGRRMTNAVTRNGVRQNIPTPTAGTGLVECRWTSPYTLTIPNTSDATNWASGIYVAKLTANTGPQRYIPFVVRDDARVAPYLFQSSVTTMQAYNGWGGKSLYDFNSTFDQRAYKVSFNRPYSDGWGTGDLINDWSGWELNMLRFLEREGFDVAYCTNIDTHARANQLSNCKAFLSVGHDEYWSWQMRDRLEAGRNGGKHLGFFTSNAAYWQIRLENGYNGAANRTQVCYKGAYAQDPFYNDATKRKYTTTTWRDPIVNRAEEALLGLQYAYYPVDADIVISNANHWVFANTGLRNGDTLPGLCGYEADRIYNIPGVSPANVIQLAHSPLVDENGPGASDMALYQHSSGANVFATGSMQWSWGLDDYFAWWSHPYRVNEAAQQITRNVLARFAQ